MISSSIPLLLCLLASATLTVAQDGPIGRTDEPAKPLSGTFGFQPPEVADVEVGDLLAPQDSIGGANQVLVALAGAPGGGFAAVWHDHRDAMTGLYLARFDAQGQRLEPERPIHSPGTQRRTEPALFLRADGSGVVAWTMVVEKHEVFVRAFDARGAFLSSDELVSGSALAATEPARRPALAPAREGGFALAWSLGTKIACRESRADGSALAQPFVMTNADAVAGSHVSLCGAGKGEVFGWWSSAQGVEIATRSRAGFLNVRASAGHAEDIAVDPRGGLWALVSKPDAAELVHLDARGGVDRPAVTVHTGAITAGALAPHAAGVVVLIEPAAAGAAESDGKPARGERGRPTATARGAAVPNGLLIYSLAAAGTPLADSPLAVPSELAREVSRPHIASNGKRVLVAWTDQRAGDNDVWARFLDFAEDGSARLAPEMRLNSDVASADQSNGQVAASGERGLIVWQDRREMPVRAYGRRFDARGFTGDEFALPRPVDGVEAARGAMERPVCAVQSNGDALVAWRAVRGNTGALQAQVVDVASAPVTPLIELDAAGDAAQPRVLALGERGWAVAFARAGTGGVWISFVGPRAGRAQAPVLVSSKDAQELCANPDLALLDDQRLLVVWDAHPGDEKVALRARFIDDTGAPVGDVVTFEPSSRGFDWDPAVAPNQKGGFALSWTAGARTDMSRDVVARLFDSRGKPISRVLQISFGTNEQDFSQIVRLADKTLAVAWEDDISYYDQTYVRRIDPQGKWLGPMMRMNRLETNFMPDRVSPSIAAFGGGFAATWGDRRRSLGFDVYLKVVGAHFDPEPKH